MKKQVLTLALGLFSILFASAQTTVSVHDIQYVSPSDLASCKDLSAYDGQEIKTVGVVMHDGGLTELASGSVTGGYRPGVHIMDTAAGGVMGNFAGIQIHGVYSGQLSQPVTALNNLVAGMIVEIVGTVNNFSGETQIYPKDNSSVTVIGTTSAPTPKVINLGVLNDNSRSNVYTSGEEYEGSLVTLENVTVVGVSIFSGNRVSFDVSDVNGNLINVSDRFIAQKQASWNALNGSSPQTKGQFTPPVVGTKYESLTGIVLHSQNGCSGGTGRGYELNPFSADHYKVGDTPPSITQVSRSPLVPASGNVVTLTAKMVDFNGTVVDQKLFYSTNLNQDNTAFTPVSMTLKSGSTDEFEANIPAFTDGTIVRYYITADDNDGNKSYEPFSAAKASGSTSFYTVRDNGLSIVDLQKVLNPVQDASPYKDQTVTVKGYVIASAKPYDLEDIYIQDKDATEFAGIKLTGNADLLDLWRTEEVEVTGKVVESFGNTQLEVTSVSKTGKTFDVAPIELPVSDSAGRANGGMEKYESMLVKMVNSGGKVKIANPRLNPFGEFMISNDTAANFANSTKVQTGVKNSNNNSSLWVSLVSNDTFANIDGIMEVTAVEATKDMDMDAIVGVIYYGFSQFALKPRNNDDIIGFSQTLESAKYASDTAKNSVVELTNLGVSFYPNPANNVLNIQVGNNGNGTLAIRSLEGRLVSQTEILGSTSVNISSLLSGVYFLEYTNATGQRASAKFVKL
ncbi:MAG TPA: hypothetical protein DEQ56_04130 [Bacteroidetes bacterium]|jgi:hypothetical protein|nr:hypothetical protein [Bacteroidota bacterium]